MWLKIMADKKFNNDLCLCYELKGQGSHFVDYHNNYIRYSIMPISPDPVIIIMHANRQFNCFKLILCHKSKLISYDRSHCNNYLQPQITDQVLSPSSPT